MHIGELKRINYLPESHFLKMKMSTDYSFCTISVTSAQRENSALPYSGTAGLNCCTAIRAHFTAFYTVTSDEFGTVTSLSLRISKATLSSFGII